MVVLDQRLIVNKNRWCLKCFFYFHSFSLMALTMWLFACNCTSNAAPLVHACDGQQLTQHKHTSLLCSLYIFFSSLPPRQAFMLFFSDSFFQFSHFVHPTRVKPQNLWIFKTYINRMFNNDLCCFCQPWYVLQYSFTVLAYNWKQNGIQVDGKIVQQPEAI